MVVDDDFALVWDCSYGSTSPRRTRCNFPRWGWGGRNADTPPPVAAVTEWRSTVLIVSPRPGRCVCNTSKHNTSLAATDASNPKDPDRLKDWGDRTIIVMYDIVRCMIGSSLSNSLNKSSELDLLEIIIFSFVFR
jgi:hypothetical protein